MNSDTINKEVKALLLDEFGLSELQSDTSLFKTGELDSMDVLKLIFALEQKYGFKVAVFEVSLDTFDCVASISRYIETMISNSDK